MVGWPEAMLGIAFTAGNRVARDVVVEWMTGIVRVFLAVHLFG